MNQPTSLPESSFQSGKDAPSGGKGGSIRFIAGNTGEVVLEFRSNGDFIHRGKTVVNDKELHAAWWEYIRSCQAEPEYPSIRHRPSPANPA